MPGYDLTSGQYENRTLSDDEMWSAFSNLFSSHSKNSSSYKFGFLKAIMDNLYNVDENLTLTFDQLFGTFTEVYWNLVLKHGIRQQPIMERSSGTYLEQALNATAARYAITADIPFESISDEAKIEVCKKIKSKCKINVVGALFGDTKGLFYSFSRKEEWLQINPQMYEFVCKHKLAIEKLNYYEWAKYLEKINDDSVMDHLLTKIDKSSERENLSVYRRILFEEFENESCFYCGKKLSNDGQKVHVDHFVPRAFIKDDKMWNLVLACPTCNLQKNDKLASIIYLDKLLDRNKKIILINKKAKDMGTYNAQNLRAVYYWAKINGYDNIWQPKKISEV
ncbi:MAG: HNH endonuclease [Lachnospiraceae bacterium]|nr:HNH endonuclease [Lachnospiraceae bacterium]